MKVVSVEVAQGGGFKEMRLNRSLNFMEKVFMKRETGKMSLEKMFIVEKVEAEKRIVEESCQGKSRARAVRGEYGKCNMEGE